jgi:hypothetical protein
VVVEKQGLLGCTLMAADLKGFLANCFVGGESGSIQSEGRWVRDTIALRFGGRDVSIVQKPRALILSPSKYNGWFVETTTVVVRDVRAEQRSEVRELLERLSYLLSFAGCSQVACYGWEHAENPPLREHWATVARARYSRPTLDIRRGEVVRCFLEGVWPEYFRLEEGRDLRRVIDLFVIAETHGLPLELRLATLFILLENVKSTYAREQGFAFDGRNYLKSSGRAWSFNGLLSEMLKGVGMRQPDLRPIVDLRNEIVHSGASQTTFEHQDQIYDDCQDIAREYLLRSWGYSGDFRLSAVRGMSTKRI